MTIEKLKEAARNILPEVDVVIGYRQGFDPLHATPYFITKPEQVDQLIWNPLCVQNLCSYLPFLKGKVGVMVKGCVQPHDCPVHAGKINRARKC